MFLEAPRSRTKEDFAGGRHLERGGESEAGTEVDQQPNNDIVRRVVPKDRRDNPGESTRSRSESTSVEGSQCFSPSEEKKRGETFQPS